MAGPHLHISISNKRAGKALLELESRFRAPPGVLMVGINPNRRYYARRRKPVPIVRVAAWNEFGVPNKGGAGWRVPPRPAVSTALHENVEKYNTSFQARVVRQLQRRGITPETMKATMLRLGEIIVGDIRRSIEEWNDPRNAAATVEKKGFDNPLIETRKFVNAFEAIWIAGNVPASRAIARAARSFAAFKGSVGKK